MVDPMSGDTQRCAAELFPGDYSSWRYCIESKCGLALTAESSRARIAILGGPRHEEARRFAKRYGSRR